MKTLFLILCVCFIPFSQSSDHGGVYGRLSEPADTYVRTHSEPLLQQTSDHDGSIESKYDGFQKETVVSLRKMRISCGGAQGLESTIKDLCTSFAVSLHAPGLQLNQIRFVKVQFIFETKDWDRRHAVSERELIVIADQETLKLGRMRLVTQGMNSDRFVEVMKEVLEVTIPYETFRQIARSQYVEVKIGKTMFALKDRNVAALRDLNNRVKF